MPTEEQVREKLKTVLVPGPMRDLVVLNLLRNVEVKDGKVKITIASAALNPSAQDWLKAKISSVVRTLSGTNGVTIEFVAASPKELNQVHHVVAIMSGKGGVGKSLVTGLLAIALARKGLQVGILDADITGPSIPRMFGLTGHPSGSDTGLLPITSRLGIEVMSINLLLPQEDDAVIWRGPLIGNAVKQFWEETLWGRLDFLMVDLPPGTADVPLTVMQSLPLTGVVIVFSPQELAAMVVRKAVKMARDSMNIPILGVVENMSYLTLPDSGKKMELFGPSRGEEMAKATGAPLLGQIPIDPEMASLCDKGKIELYRSELVDSMAVALLQSISSRTG